jgi:hypothetical protein
LRPLDKPGKSINHLLLENNFDVVKKSAIESKQTLSVISRINGWLTVDPESMNRKDAFEKRKTSNVRKTSMMSPLWMQCEAKRDEERFNMFKVVSTNGSNMRIEQNRVILNDKQDLQKSIFNIGSLRYNTMMMPDLNSH